MQFVEDTIEDGSPLSWRRKAVFWSKTTRGNKDFCIFSPNCQSEFFDFWTTACHYQDYTCNIACRLHNRATGDARTVEAVEFIGFSTLTTAYIFDKYQLYLNPQMNPGALYDFVRSHIYQLRSNSTNDEAHMDRGGEMTLRELLTRHSGSIQLFEWVEDWDAQLRWSLEGLCLAV